MLTTAPVVEIGTGWLTPVGCVLLCPCQQDEDTLLVARSLVPSAGPWVGLPSDALQHLQQHIYCSVAGSNPEQRQWGLNVVNILTGTARPDFVAEGWGQVVGALLQVRREIHAGCQCVCVHDFCCVASGMENIRYLSVCLLLDHVQANLAGQCLEHGKASSAAAAPDLLPGGPGGLQACPMHWVGGGGPPSPHPTHTPMPEPCCPFTCCRSW
jgi:hypothetical protein